MARFYKLLAVGCWLTFAGLFLSCQEGGEAGDLFGQWRLTGTDHKYIAFSGSVSLFRGGGTNYVFGNFRHIGDSLLIECVSMEGIKEDTTFVEEELGFKPFTDIRLRIEQLDADHLVLSKDGRDWHFYKY